MTQPARRYAQHQTHYIRKDFTFADTGIGSGVYIGTIPANALITGVMLAVQTAFNAATTNTAALGSAAGGAQLMAATSIASAGVATGTVVAATGGVLSPTAPVDLYLTYAQTGAAATAGVGSVVVHYTIAA